MIIQQIRNATLKIKYSSGTFLIDPWLQDQGTGFSAKAVRLEMQGIKCPMNALPDSLENILKDVDYCFVTHLHFDHLYNGVCYYIVRSRRCFYIWLKMKYKM